MKAEYCGIPKSESSKGDGINGQQGRKNRTGLRHSGSQGNKVFQGERGEWTMSNTLFIEVEKQSSNYES